MNSKGNRILVCPLLLQDILQYPTKTDIRNFDAL